MDLRDKIILVTGATGGIGSSVVSLLERESSKVIKHSSKIANYTHTDEIIRMFEDIKKEYGKLDILINTVGIENTNDDQLDTSKWEEMFKVNLFGAAECSKQAINLMNGGGVIVHIASIMGNGGIVCKSSLAYSITKAGLQKLSENLALMYSQKGIRVFSVSPGYTDTPIWSSFNENQKQDAKDDMPIKRFIKPEEVVKYIVDCVENDAITGVNMTLSGGLNLKSIIQS